MRTSLRAGLGIGLLCLALILGCAWGRKQEDQTTTAQAHYKMGLSYLNEGRLQRALVEFQKALELDPDNKRILYALGYVYDQLEQYTEAVSSYKRALQLDPDFAEAHNALGVVYAKLLQWDAAIEEYRLALANPRYLTPQRAYFNLGKAYFNQSEYEKALEAFQQAARIQPEEGLFHFWIGRTYTRLDQMDQAVAAFQEAVKRLPQSGEAHYYLGLALVKQGKRRGALQHFQKVLELAPGTELAQNALRFLEGLQ